MAHDADLPPEPHDIYGDCHTPTNKVDATVPPTGNDDVDLGYGVGSRWFDLTNDKAYICLDATAAAAVWIEITRAGADYICLQDQKAQNTHGGTFTAGAWRTRDLTTEQSDAGTHCSLAANQFTLDAGDYVILAFVPAREVDNHQAWLYNVTDATEILVGSNAACWENAYTSSHSIIMGWFTIAASKALEIQHRGTVTQATYGFGYAKNWTTEVYTVVQLWKVA